jgi:hypothetical protein
MNNSIPQIKDNARAIAQLGPVDNRNRQIVLPPSELNTWDLIEFAIPHVPTVYTAHIIKPSKVRKVSQEERRECV